jgi:hypothetical protein
VLTGAGFASASPARSERTAVAIQPDCAVGHVGALDQPKYPACLAD